MGDPSTKAEIIRFALRVNADWSIKELMRIARCSRRQVVRTVREFHKAEKAKAGNG